MIIVSAELEELVEDGLEDVPGAAQFLKVSRAQIYRFMDLGDLQWVKLGKSRRIPRRALVNFAAAHLVGG